jgi:beta-lactamase regulating signal transducer with metallopeptidase domain/FtsZ-binding cell division protein ZapB
MTDALALLVPPLAMALLHFLWQGTLVALLAWLALAMLRNARPQARYAVACLALLACVLLPAWSLALAVYDATAMAPLMASAGDSSLAVQSVQGNALHAPWALVPADLPPLDLLPWVVALWAAGVGLLSLRMACGWLWVQRLCRRAQADPGGPWQACVDRLAPRLGIARTVVLRLVESGDSPATAGWWRPVVLLPVAVAARMPADLVEALVAHELAHIRRHDYLVNLLQGVVEALLFYHPVVWWLSRRIRTERELVADDLAAAALGEPRRLALALSELDRHSIARSPIPQLHYAPAAHGGHLMSRIQQLVRPQRRAIGGTAVLPLLGLALAGAAFYSHAQIGKPDSVAAQPSPVPMTAAQTLPAPVAIPGKPVLPTLAAAPRPKVVAGADQRDRERSGYALVRAGSDGYTMSGNTDDMDDIRLARRHIDGDFLWFRRDGKAWVVRDAATVARARAAWSGTDALSEQMQALDARMKPHAERMQALAARMEGIGTPDASHSSEMRAATAKMQALGERMAPIVERQVALAMRMREASQADQSHLEREQEELERAAETLAMEMEQHGAALEAWGERMKAQYAPMEALGREMEAASGPMKAIGEEMKALGKRIEREAQVADRQVRQLIDDAYRSGRAQPAPAQQ